ncbi:hypothetical protein LZ31DRAFT_133628 [Colletotrichum somersetense]|nr:hypothetical protein LZ31DRAFT_133628 [Colletotrichum somersetense]
MIAGVSRGSLTLIKNSIGTHGLVPVSVWVVPWAKVIHHDNGLSDQFRVRPRESGQINACWWFVRKWILCTSVDEYAHAVKEKGCVRHQGPPAKIEIIFKRSESRPERRLSASGPASNARRSVKSPPTHLVRAVQRSSMYSAKWSWSRAGGRVSREMLISNHFSGVRR